MARPIRLEEQGAVWHVTSRGNEQRDIFRDDADRLKFIQLLAITVKRNRWLLHTYTLMTNHFHLVIETPHCTLSKGMHWLNSCYAGYFNRRHKRVGHLYQGRPTMIRIDEQTYLNEVRRYTVLNPVAAHMVDHPAAYMWSSYRAHAGLGPIPDWLYSDWLFELDSDPAKCHEIYRRHVAERSGSPESIWDHLVGQVYLGSEEWIEKMRRLVESKLRSDEHSMSQRLIPRLKMAKVVKAVAEACDIDEKDLRHRHGGVARMIAAWIGWNEGLMRLREIAAALRLRSTGYISTLIRRAGDELAKDEPMRIQARRAIAILQPV